MLRGRTVGRAALALVLGLLWASPAAADMTIGGACSAGAGSPQAADGNNVWCNGSIWQYPAYHFGSTALSCTATQAGTIQWTGSAFQGCNGTSWGPIDLSTGAALSSLLAATTTNSIDSGNWAQTWKWGTLSTQTALTLTTSSMTGGTLLNLSDSLGTTTTGKVLSVTDATTGAGYGIYSSVTGTANTGYAGYFLNTATTGAGYSVAGVNASASGLGVYGTNTASGGIAVEGLVSSGAAVAVYGLTSSTANFTYGVEGFASGTSGQVYGVYGQTSSPSGYGVAGVNTGNNGIGLYGEDSTGDAAGVEGYTASSTFGAAGVWARAAGSSGATFGLYAENDGSGTGYAGYFTDTGTPANYGVYATTASTGTGYAVYGSITGAANTGYAGYFTNSATSGYGVYGSSNSGYAGYFNGTVVQGSGVKLTTTATSGFMNIAQTNGAPAGTPAVVAGSVPITVNNNGIVYAWNTSGSAWVRSGNNAPLSGLQAATTTNSIDSSNWAQIWAWGMLSTQTALTLTTSSMTTGTLLSLSNSAGTSGAGTVLNVSNAQTGAAYGVYSAVTGAANTGYAGYFSNSSTGGWSVYAAGAENYFQGSVGIGIASPSQKLDVANDGTQYGVNVRLEETSYAGSKRAGMYVGTGWQIGQDEQGNGTQSFFIFNTGTLNSPIVISPSNSIGLNTSVTQAGYLVTSNGGIYASSGNSAAAAVYGVNTSSGGTNYGGYFSNATTAAGYGVYATISGAANTGYAGYFSATSTGAANYGLYASTSSATGYAGYFQGAVNINGALTVSSCAGCSVGASAALSSITSATTTNSIDNTNMAQTWKWGSLSAQTALTLTTSSMTTGTLLALANTSSAANGGTVLSVANGQAGASFALSATESGVANTGYAGFFVNTATSGANYGVYGSNASVSGYAGFFTNSSTGGYALYTGGSRPAYFNGSVGIGSATPAQKLDVTGNLNLTANTNGIYIANAKTFFLPNADTTSLAIGSNAGASQTATNLGNIGIGQYALNAITTGSGNTAVGYDTLSDGTTGGGNVAIGWNAMGNSANPTHGTAVGYQALENDVSSYNVAVGYNALLQNVSGSANVAFGNAALQNGTSATGNVGVGYNALIAANSGSNTGIGWTALGSATTGSGNNTALGAAAGGSVTTGNNNVFVGSGVGSTTLKTGANNILIGTSNAVDTPASGTSNFLSVGNLYEGDVSIGHAVIHGTAPAVTAGASDCGTSPSIAGNDNVGLITVGTSTNGGICTATFHTAWTTAPVCFCQDQTTGNQLRPVTTTTTLKCTGTLAAGDAISYMCLGYQL